MATVPETLTLALEHHQTGRLQAAGQLYQQILQADPNHADALHLLGVIAHQIGRHQLAVGQIRRAIEANPNAAEFHSNLASAYEALGQFDEAVASCRRALQLNPDSADAHNNLGNALRAQGRLEEAVASYRQALCGRTNFAKAHNNLGNALKDQGKLDQAVVCYRQALRIQPEYADAHVALGSVFQEQGNLVDAVDRYRRALKIKPDSVEVHNKLGMVLGSQGKFDEAVASCRQALQLDPDSGEAHNNLGNCFKAQGRLEDAVISYRRSLRSRRDCAGVHNNLGNALKGQGKLDQAVDCFREAVRIQPDNADAHLALGMVFQEQGKLDEAAAAYRQALQIQPDNADAHNNLGVVLTNQHHVDEAAASFRRALEIRPDCADALGNLAALYEEHSRMAEAESAVAEGLRILPDDPLINLAAARCEERQGRHQEAMERLERISAWVQPDGYVAKDIRYQLGRLCDRLGQGTPAFEHFTEANRLASQQVQGSPIDREQFFRDIDTLAEVFSREWVNSWSAAGPSDTDETPVFLIGFPRSGTTLLDVILDSHPEIQVMEEKPTVFELGKGLRDMPDGYPRAMADLTPAQIAELRDAYYRAADRFIDRQPGKILVDKHPLNTVQTGLILRVFPTAKFIVAQRHPCDVCLSCWMQNFKDNKAMVNFFTLEDAAKLYDKVMGLWQQYVRVLPHAHCVVRYEDLVDDFDAQTQRLLQFLGVDWDDAVRQYHQHAVRRRSINTPSYRQVTEPIYKRACNRWHRYAEQLQPIMGVLQPYIESFGYGGEGETGPGPAHIKCVA